MYQIILTISVLVYLLITGYLGYVAYRKTQTTTDFLLAGREAHPYIMAMSYGATFISTSAIVGFGGTAALFGMSLLWLTFLNIFVGIFIAFVFFGHRTRAIGYNLDSHTFPELLGKRYQSRFIQVFSGILIFLFMPVYTAAVLMGATQFLVVNLKLDYGVALFAFSAIVAIYVVMGGLKGVMYTDAFQGSVMFIGMLFLLFFTYHNLGGASNAHATLETLNPKIMEIMGKIGHRGFTHMPAFGSNAWWTVVSTIVLGVGIGVLAQPQLVTRFMTVRSGKELNRATLVGGIFILAMTGVAFTVGAVSNVYFYNTTGKISFLAANKQVDSIIPMFVEQTMPKWFGILFLVTLFAAAMSTMSSQYHTIGAALSRDIAETVTRKRTGIGLNRLGTSIGIILSTIVAWGLPRFYETGSEIIARGTSIFFGLCASSFLPMYFGALYSKRITRSGAIAGMLAGFLSSMFWFFFVHEKESQALRICQALFGRPSLWGEPWKVVDPIVVSLPLAVIVTILVSRFTKPMEENHLRTCFNGLK
ncbi:MAG: sodium:solute symporter family protein [Candidatus Caldatribacteriaceae bacterium]